MPLGRGFPGGASGKEPTCSFRRPKRRRFDPWVGKIPWRRAWQPTPVFLPGESHGQRSLADYSPWGCKVLDVTQQLRTHTRRCAYCSPLPLPGAPACSFLLAGGAPPCLLRFSGLHHLIPGAFSNVHILFLLGFLPRHSSVGSIISTSSSLLVALSLSISRELPLLTSSDIHSLHHPARTQASSRSSLLHPDSHTSCFSAGPSSEVTPNHLFSSPSPTSCPIQAHIPEVCCG